MQSLLLDQHTDQNLRLGSTISHEVARPHPPQPRALEHLGGRSDFEVSAVHSGDRDKAWQVADVSHSSGSDKEGVKSIEAIQDPIGSLTDFILNSVTYREEKNVEEMPTLVAEVLRYKHEHHKQWNACFGQRLHKTSGPRG